MMSSLLLPLSGAVLWQPHHAFPIVRAVVHAHLIHLDADASHDENLTPSGAAELALYETLIFPHKDCHPETSDANNVRAPTTPKPVMVMQLSGFPNYHHHTCLYVLI